MAINLRMGLKNSIPLNIPHLHLPSNLLCKDIKISCSFWDFISTISKKTQYLCLIFFYHSNRIYFDFIIKYMEEAQKNAYEIAYERAGNENTREEFWKD